MKLKSTFSFLVLLLVCASAFGAPLSGTYTIGGTNPSYTTFSLAVADLNSRGVNGPVVFNVRAGTYNEEIEITNFTGSSATNTVIFQSETGVAADVLLTYAGSGLSDNWVVKLDEATYVTFNKITMQATGATYSRVFWMVNYSQYDTVKNCVLTAPVATTSNMNQLVLDAGDDNTTQYYNGFYNDTIYNGSYGFYTQGSGSCYVRHLLVENNVFLNQYAYGICANGQFGLIKGNLIMTDINNTSYYGIYINIAIDSLCNNKIINCPGNGIWWDNGAPNIFNNFITTTGTAATYGLTFTDMNESGTESEIAYNTVLVLNTNAASSAFYIPTGYAQPIYFIRNNIFVNRGGGYAVNIVATGEVNTGSSVYNNNDYYTTGTNLGSWSGTNITTLANWQSNLTGCSCGGDANSKNINPSFVSNTDLHLATDNMRFGLYDYLVLYDIDGQTRNTTTPDVGADEYDSAQVKVHAAFTGSPTNICPGSSVTFTDQSTGTPTNWYWSFPGGTPDTSTTQNPMVQYQSSGIYPVTLVVSNGGSIDTLTDTSYIHVIPQPFIHQINSPFAICTGDSAKIIATLITGFIQWQIESAPGVFTNIPGADSGVFNTGPLTDSATYRVIATNGMCGDTSNLVAVTVSPLPTPPVLTPTSDTICAGDSTAICVSGYFTSYTWNLTEWYTTDTTRCIYASKAGNYYVTVADNNGCTAVSNHISITVYPVPSVGIVEEGDTLSTYGGIAYQWYYNGNLINGATSAVYIVPCPDGNYSVLFTDSNGCKTLTNIYFAIEIREGGRSVDCDFGFPQLDDNSHLKLYPNPAENMLNIDIENATGGIKQVEVYDVVGRVAINKQYDRTPIGSLTLDFTALPPGIYFVLVRAGEKEYLQKVVKE